MCVFLYSGLSRIILLYEYLNLKELNAARAKKREETNKRKKEKKREESRKKTNHISYPLWDALRHDEFIKLRVVKS